MFLNSTILDQLQKDLGRDLVAFLPELILCGGIVLLLILRLFAAFNRLHLGWVALIVTMASLGVSWAQWQGEGGFSTPADYNAASRAQELFTGLIVYDNFTIFIRLFLLGFAALVIWLTMLTGIPDREDSADFYCLLLGATVGMALMASANHLLMVYIAVEMASLPSYALAGFLKGKRQSSEASLKYVVYGGGASGVMLYGISLLAGKFGTGYLPQLATAYTSVLSQGTANLDLILLLGTLFILIGVGFKLAAVPFHFWCPDVFEGAAAEVGAFLSVASKGAALALLGRFALGLTGLGELTRNVSFEDWRRVAQYLVPALAVFAALTATFGNLAAYTQTNLKRLLAYSTIAHAGYMMMGLAPLSRQGAAAVLFYLVVYLFMNLGAFAVVAFLRNETGSEDLSTYRGMGQRSPLMAVLLSLFLLSLLGIPPLAGFAAKLQIFSVLVNGGMEYTRAGSPGLGYTLYALLVIGGLNTAISAVYYVKVLKVMFLDQSLEEVEGSRPEEVEVSPGAAFFATFLAAMLIGIGIFFNQLLQASDEGVNRFHTFTKPVQEIAEGRRP